MADLCKSCGIRIYGFDTKDLEGISTLEDTEQGLYAQVLCEGCGGHILVDHTGLRVYPPEEPTKTQEVPHE